MINDPPTKRQEVPLADKIQDIINIAKVTQHVPSIIKELEKLKSEV